ncbi:Uncharacterised protein [Mycobacteroides abscessus subsp. abscessus]|nr:Uncharacterised protein [Mycobacteroides abscessus subsp. abscessus]
MMQPRQRLRNDECAEPGGNKFYCVRGGLGPVTDGDAGGVRPRQDVIERQQRRLAIEICGGDHVDGAEKVIGGYHGHRRFFVERNKRQPRGLGRRPEQRDVDGAVPHHIGRFGGGDGAQLQGDIGMTLRPDPCPLRGRPTGDVPEGK